MPSVRTIFLMATLVLLAGCRAPLKTQTFDPRLTPVDEVAVLPVHHDDELIFEYANDQLETLNRLAPGPLGTALSAAVGAVGRGGFNDLYPVNAESYARYAQDRLLARLARAGIDPLVVAGLPSADGGRTGGLLDSMPAVLGQDVDAVLESYLELGFVAATRGAPWRPTAWLTLRLVDPSGQVILSERIMFNALTRDEGDLVGLRGIRLPVPDRFAFDGEASILSDGAGDEALRFAIDRLAEEATLLLQGPWQQSGP